MIEPIAGNMNFVRASVPFMQRCRELCTQHGALLVFDEVMTGFRVALGGAQSVYAKAIPGFTPDLTVLGKVIGGGMPLAAFGGPRAIMEQLAPLGPVYQAGTLSGNPVATACGLATLKEIAQAGLLRCAWRRKTATLVDGLKAAAAAEGVPFSADCEGGMFGFFLLPELPQNYSQVMKSDGAQLQPAVPRPAGPRRLHRAGAVRGRLRQRGAQRGGHRRDGRGGARGVQARCRASACTAASAAQRVTIRDDEGRHWHSRIRVRNRRTSAISA